MLWKCPGKYLYGAGLGTDTITSYGPTYPYKGGSGPAGSGEKVRHHPLTAHVTICQAGGGTANFRQVGSIETAPTPASIRVAS